MEGSLWPKIVLAATLLVALILTSWLHLASESPNSPPVIAQEPMQSRLAPGASEPRNALNASDVGQTRIASASPPEPSGGAILLAVESARPFPRLAVAVTDANVRRLAPYIQHTDDQGQLRLPPGRWHLDFSNVSCQPPSVDLLVESNFELVWLQAAADLVVRVVDAHDLAIPKARVGLFENDASIGATVVTDADGIARFGAIHIDAGTRVLVTHPAYDPLYTTVDHQVVADGVVAILVQPRPCAKSWTILVQDCRGQPLGGATIGVCGQLPDLNLGATGVDGRLVVPGNWMFGDCFWLLSGSAYDLRVAPPPWADIRDRSEFVLTAPRRCWGSLCPTGLIGDPIEWRFIEATPHPSGTGIQTRIVSQAAPVGVMACDLPDRWPTRVQCVCRGILIFEQVLDVEGNGWTLSAVLEAPRNFRRMHVRSLGSRIETVRSGARVLFPSESGQDPRAATAAVDLDIGRGNATIELSMTNGVRLLIIGQPGDQDVALTLAATASAEASFQVVDQQGVPVRDVVLRLSQQMDRTNTDLGVPGWSLMIGGNVHRASVNADGATQLKLPAGRYRVDIENLAQRDALGLSWPPVDPLQVVVAESNPERFVVKIPRPRSVRIDLEMGPGALPPGTWRLQVGEYSAAFGGNSCRVWLTEAAQELLVLGSDNQQLGVGRLPAGSGPLQVRIAILTTLDPK